MKTLLYFSSLFLLLSMHLLSGDVPASNEALSSDIQPRTDNGSWLYVSTYFEDGQQAGVGSTKEEVIATKVIDGTTCYLVRLSFDWRTLFDRFIGKPLTEDDYDYFWEYFTEEGSYNFSVDGPNPGLLESLDGFELTMPFPVKKGASYATSESKYTVVDTAALIEVPAGDFTCVVYQVDELDESAAEPSRERYYMAPGVGLVRWEMEYLIDGAWVLDSRDNLVEYSLK